ncbi:hypothetical protein [Streptomyces pacificus]|uniref:Uncharacterized protein n=1 Tax=Streptomyces pacificus TaxID=2705029 RepID=A0A6A0AMY8_9ACTN|nr:hypothetical protein [Streptomyces pacificus]GFH34316.1 hypothetical protein SCWH03_05300 [Streptomyces pacificus]
MTQQGSHHYILTLDRPGRTGVTSHGTFTPLPGETRADAFSAIKEHVVQQHPDMAGAVTSFFAIEPNQL